MRWHKVRTAPQIRSRQNLQLYTGLQGLSAAYSYAHMTDKQQQAYM